MKTNVRLVTILVLINTLTFSQDSTSVLKFTAENNGEYVRLHNIKIINLTQGGDYNEMYWPDTTYAIDLPQEDNLLFVGYTFNTLGIPEIDPNEERFLLFQNYPNPASYNSLIEMYIPEKGTVTIEIADMQGLLVNVSDWELDKGKHSFSFTVGSGNIFIITAIWNGASRSIKVLSTGANTGKECSIVYVGAINHERPLKSIFSAKDALKQESAILFIADHDETYRFQFAANIPCLGTPTVDYEGQVYNTIQIFSQCWMKENLNIGVMLKHSTYQSNNGIIEKYCYNNEIDSCTKYGGIYNWWEMMQFVNIEGVQGICPTGWHIPTTQDWKILEGVADTLWDFGDPDWEVRYAGSYLKATYGWHSGGNGTDFYGFSGSPGGTSRWWYDEDAGEWCYYFENLGERGIWWTSRPDGEENSKYSRVLSYNSDILISDNPIPEWHYQGASVRCIRDY